MASQPSLPSVHEAIVALRHLDRLISGALFGDSCDIIEKSDPSAILINAARLLPSLKLPAATIEELEEVAVSLWNASSQAMNAEVRATAFWALNLATSKTASGHTKILRAAFSAARSCMEADLLDSALKILEASAQRLDSLKRPTLLIDQDRLYGIATEYYMLRAHLEFLKCRPDIADHLFARAPLANRLGNRDLVIKTCYRAGIDALVVDLNAATMWLQRAVEQVELSIAKNETTSGDIGIWNIRCRATLVRAYLATKKISRRRDIKNQLENLKRSNGDALSVMVLEIEVIRQDEKPDCQRILEVLKSIMESPGLTHQGWELVSNFARALWNLSPDFATEAFHSMVSNIPSKNTELLRRTFLRLVSLSTSLAKSSHTCIDAVGKGAQILGSRADVELGEDIVQAVVMLIWKRIEAEVAASAFGIAEQWGLQILEGNIFGCLSDSNKLAVMKKYTIAVLGFWGEDKAEKAIQTMMQIPGADSDYQVLFLEFRHVLQKDECCCEFRESLVKILDMNEKMIPSFGMEFLFICTWEASLRCMPGEVIQCLNLIFQEGPKNPPQDGPSFQDRQRLTSAILFFEFQRGHYHEEYVALAMAIFGGLSDELWEDISDEDINSLPGHEIDWLLSNGSNLALHLFESAPSMDEVNFATINGFLNNLTNVLYLHEDDFWVPWDIEGLELPDDNLINTVICVFYLQGAIQVQRFNACAAGTEKKEIYTMLKAAWSLPNKLFDCLVPLPESIADLMACFTISLFRCAIFMGDYYGLCDYIPIWPGNVGYLFRRGILGLTLLYERFIPKAVRLDIVLALIELYYESGGSCPCLREDFPRWLRIYFDLCFSDEVPGDPAAPSEKKGSKGGQNSVTGERYLRPAECVLNQALALVEDEDYIKSATHQEFHKVTDSETGVVTTTPCEQHKYPSDELEYLAVRSFNQALDYFAEGKDKDCNRWALKSIRLAEGMGDQKGASLAEDFRARLKTCLS